MVEILRFLHQETIAIFDAVMLDIDQKWIRLSPNGKNPGWTILDLRVKMYGHLI